MTLLTRIRSKSGLLVTIIAIALLVFILESALESRYNFFSKDRTKVAVINGNEINIEDFTRKIEQAEENEKQRTGRTTLDEGSKESVRMQVWNQTINENVIQPRYAELGINVSTEELFDMVQGKDPHPQIKQSFVDQNTKQFDPKLVMNFLKNMEKDETGDSKNRWLIFENAIKDERMAQKYTNMVKKGFYITKAEAVRQYQAENKKVAVQFVVQKYQSIADSTIQVNEEDLRKYYNENKGRYKQKETIRGIDYVEFEVTPSTEDRLNVLNAVTKLVPEFQSCEVDSDYVNSNADTRYVETYMSGSKMNPFMDTLKRAPLKTVIGPYFENNTYKLAKLSAIKMRPDSVKARHILIKATDKLPLAKAKEKADSLKKLIESGAAKFDLLAPLFSADPGSAAKGGDLGFFAEGMMVKPFNDACFDGKVGELQVVESQFGVHLIEVTAKQKDSPKYLISYIDRKILPSSQTYNAMYNKASQFAGKNNEKSLFEKAIKEQKLNKRTADYLRETERAFNGMENTREVVRWAYQAKKGDVSGVFQVGDKYLVCMLTAVKEKGILPFEEVSDKVAIEVKKQKKADQFEAKLKQLVKPGATIDQIAASLGVSPEIADNITFSTGNFGSGGMESAVIGKVFTYKPQSLQGPVRGDNGVYVIYVSGVIDAPPVTDDYKMVKTNTQNSIQGRVDYEIFDALKEKAEIEDYRGNFF